METRKIQTTASGSFFITLPKSWVTELEIEKGDELTMARDENGSLKVTPLKEHEKYYSEFVIPIEEYQEENSIERSINSSYIQGSDIIVINSVGTISAEKKKLIKNCTSNLIGTEISEELSNKLTIRILVDPRRFPLADLINRIYKLVDSMHQDAMKSFYTDDDILAQDVVIREAEVDKLFFLMLRQLNLSLSGRLDLSEICQSELKIDCVLGILLARDLSKMAHYAAGIAQQSLKLKDKDINEELKLHLREMSRFIINMQQNAIMAFFRNDFMRANKVLNNIQTVKDMDLQTENEVLNKVEDFSTIISLTAISRYLRNIANSAVAVSEDLQAKHRPKTTIRRAKVPETPVNEFDIYSQLGYEIK